MKIYYYETITGRGAFKARNDKEALNKIPENTICLYREDSKGNSVVLIGE